MDGEYGLFPPTQCEGCPELFYPPVGWPDTRFCDDCTYQRRWNREHWERQHPKLEVQG